MNLRNKTCLVVDHGLNLPFAQKMGESYGKVFYYVPVADPYPCTDKDEIGTGFSNIERIYDTVYPKVNGLFRLILSGKPDIICFPDVGFGDIQFALRKMGKRVYGSGDGEAMELDKWAFNEYLKKAGLPTAKMEKVIGTRELRKYLGKNPDSHVKISYYRGSFETMHNENKYSTDLWLDDLESHIGMTKNEIEFLVQDPIESEFEVGYDGFNICGEYPANSMFGVEVKDQGYVGLVVKEHPPLIRYVNQKMAPIYKKLGYYGPYSNEIRVSDEEYSTEFRGRPYPIDETCRTASPPGCLQTEIYEPHCLARAVWDISEGKIPKLSNIAKYGAELILSSPVCEKHWLHVSYPKELDRWVKLKFACQKGGQKWILPNSNGGIFGSVVAIGNTPQQVCDLAMERLKQVTAQELVIKEDVFKKAAEQFKKMKDFGML